MAKIVLKRLARRFGAREIDHIVGGQRYKSLTPDQIDNLGLALIGLAKELWAMRDRQLVMEALLQERGLLGDLDAYQPGPELTERLAAERQRFLDNLVTGLLDSGDAKLPHRD